MVSLPMLLQPPPQYRLLWGTKMASISYPRVPFLRFLVICCLLSFKPGTLIISQNWPKKTARHSKDFTSVEISLVRKDHFLRPSQGNTSTFPKLNLLGFDKSWVIHRNTGYSSSDGFSQYESCMTYVISAMSHLYTQNKSGLLFDILWETEAWYGQRAGLGSSSAGQLSRTYL